MRRLLNAVMAQRAEDLADWIAPHLPAAGPVLDIGAGTGHNAVALGRRRFGPIISLDVANLHVVGARPAHFDGERMPFADDSFAAALAIYVLHYSPDPARLLREARRVCRGPVLVMQTVYAGRIAESALRLYDLGWGPLAFAVAQAARLVAPGRAPLYARALASRPLMARIAAQAGLRARLVRVAPWPLLNISRELYLLERPGQ